MRTILELVREQGKVPFPPNFGSDGNALTLVNTTQRALIHGGWTTQAIEEFKQIAHQTRLYKNVKQDYNNVINTCLATFRNRKPGE